MIIVDWSQIAISNLMAELKNTKNAEISIPLIRHMILNTLRSNRMKFKDTYGELVIACDSKHYWRKDVFPQYKANRKKSRSESDYDWDAIHVAMDTVKQELSQYFPYPVIEVHGAEADDVISSLVQWSLDNDMQLDGLELEPKPLLILSGDHDFVQLQKFPHVKQYSPIHKTWVKPTEDFHAILVDHVLRGDDGDGIPNFLSPDNSFTDKIRQKSIFAKLMDGWKKLPLEHWDTTEHKKNVDRNRQLVDLLRIPEDIKNSCINRYNAEIGLRDRTQIMPYFMANKMAIMLEYLGDF